MSFSLRYLWFHRSKDFEAMKAGKLAIWPWLSCQYTENILTDLPSLMGKYFVHVVVKKMKIEFISGVF